MVIKKFLRTFIVGLHALFKIENKVDFHVKISAFMRSSSPAKLNLLSVNSPVLICLTTKYLSLRDFPYTIPCCKTSRKDMHSLTHWLNYMKKS